MVIMPALSMLVIRGSCVAATTAMFLVRARLTSAAAAVATAMGPPARFWSLLLSDAKHHELLFKKDK